MWITLTRDMCYEALNTVERNSLLSKYEEELDDDGSASNGAPPPKIEDVLDTLISDITAEIRSHIASGRRNKLNEDTSTIPQALKSTAVVIIRYKLIARYDLAISTPRQNEYDQAQKLLSDVRTGKFAIPQPDGSDSAALNPAPNRVVPPRYWSPQRRQGIM